MEEWWKTESATRGAGSDSPTLTWCAHLFRVVNFRQHGCGTRVEGLKGFVSFPQMPSASDEQRHRAPTEEGFWGPKRISWPLQISPSSLSKGRVSPSNPGFEMHVSWFSGKS